MRRREFITLLGGAAAVWPLAARAQEPRDAGDRIRQRQIARGPARIAGAFRKGLGENGYVEGQNVTVEYHLARWPIRSPANARGGPRSASRGRYRYARQQPRCACRKSCDRDNSDCSSASAGTRSGKASSPASPDQVATRPASIFCPRGYVQTARAPA